MFVYVIQTYGAKSRCKDTKYEADASLYKWLLGRGVARNLLRMGTKEWVPSPTGYRAPDGLWTKPTGTRKLCWKFDFMSKIPYCSEKKFSAWQFRRGTCPPCSPLSLRPCY